MDSIYSLIYHFRFLLHKHLLCLRINLPLHLGPQLLIFLHQLLIHLRHIVPCKMLFELLQLNSKEVVLVGHYQGQVLEGAGQQLLQGGVVGVGRVKEDLLREVVRKEVSVGLGVGVDRLAGGYYRCKLLTLL